MAKTRIVTALCAVCSVLRPTLAIPAVYFPFNSQVPTVARVGQPYSFQLSASTFVPASSDFIYSLSEQPAWLTFDSATRTLTGAPDASDVGSTTFTLTAADNEGAAHMACTLVVSANPSPQLEGDISEQLAATANLSSTTPPVVSLLPSTAFAFQFERASFIDIVQRELYYYATLSDHTPLPGWMQLDSQTLAFAGTAPDLSAFPQSWKIDLIASDVEGFAGATASFEVSIGQQQLVFVPEEQMINISAGGDVDVARLGDTLFLNGAKVPTDSISKASAEGLPTWLTFDSETLAISGTAPKNASDTNITVSVVDAFGNEASAVVSLRVDESDDNDAQLFKGEIGTLTARAGEDFDYHFSDDLFKSQDVDVQVLLPPTARWLSFDADTRTLSGKVPTQTGSSTIEATISAEGPESEASEKQTFTIDIQPVKRAVSPTVQPSSTPSATSSASGTPALASEGEERPRRLSTGAIAGIVVGAIAAAAILAICLFVCCRRRRRKDREGYLETGSVARKPISRPILPPNSDANAVFERRDSATASEKGPEYDPVETTEKAPEPPPQIAVDIPTQPTSRRMKWSKRFSRISQVSSIGNGEDAIRADNNIPEWGQGSDTIHTPHDSFSVPTEMARSSRQLSIELSPSKRASKRLRQHRQSQQSVGLGIDTGGSAILPRHSSRGARSHLKARSSMGMSTVMDASSRASVTTQGTSVLSTTASDFPRPGTQSTFYSRTGPGLTAAEKRQSIRLVNRSDGVARDSVADTRSLSEKRQSFIRNRASTSFASPLFAHGSRKSSNPLQSGQSSKAGSSAGSQRRSQRGKSGLTTYSESSSLEPRANPKRFSQKMRSAFAPSFPRAVTRCSLGADDEFREESSSGFETISSSNSEAEWRAEMAKPRHERSWVLPNEASPTPPPTHPSSQPPSSVKRTTPSNGDSEARQKWKDRFREHSSSPLSTAVAVPVADRSPISVTRQLSLSQRKRNRLSEPISLVSSDSLSKGKLERPRLVQTSSKRPVSVEKVQRLSSMQAQTEQDSEDARPGSEMFEALESAGLMPPNSSGREGTQRSNMSGPAFI